MEIPDKSEAGNENENTNVPGNRQLHSEPGQEAKEISQILKKNKSPIRNPKIKETESQGGVSDSLKGGGR